MAPTTAGGASHTRRDASPESEVADPDLGLDGTRPVEDPDAPRMHRRLGEDLPRTLARRARRPASEALGRERGDVDALEIAAHDEGHPIGIEAPGVHVTAGRGIEPLDGRLRAT